MSLIVKNGELYRLRKEWLEIMREATELDNLSPEELAKYDIHPSRHTGSYKYEDLGKFLDDYYHYFFIKELASAEPLTHNEVAKFKEETKEFIIKAAKFANYRRELKFTKDDDHDSMDFKSADTLLVVERAIEIATEQIVPEYSFYKKGYSRHTAKYVLK